MEKGCKICYAPTQELDAQGRCGSCAAVKAAMEAGTSYGKYMAAIGSDLTRKQSRYDKIEMVNCKWCGKPFHKSGKRVYCSDVCYKAKNYETHRASILIKAGETGMRICPKCGKEFTPKRRGHTYCSKECRPSSNEKGRRKNG